jgi:PDZ domain
MHILCIHAEKPSHTPDAHGRIPFDVYFETTAPLGLRLDASLRVMGFSKTADGRIAPAEEAKWILPGDSLVAVNGKSVTSVGLNAAVLAIRDATLPKVRAAGLETLSGVLILLYTVQRVLPAKVVRSVVGLSSTDVVFGVTWRNSPRF